MKTSDISRKIFLVLISISITTILFSQVEFNSFGLITEDCKAPKNLAANCYPGGPEIIINWENPYSINQWLQHDNGINTIGLGSNLELWFAAKWDIEQLPDIETTKIYAVKFFPKNSISSLYLLIWQGPSAGSLIYEQEISEIEYDEWNTITLSTPIQIDINEELQVGFRMICTKNGAGAGEYTDNPNSDLFSADGITWQRLADLDMHYSWNLGVYIFNDEMPADFQGYQLFRDNTLINTELIQDTTYIDIIPEGTLACYKAKAVYDDCGESEFSNIDCESIMGLDKVIDNRMELFPNPVNNRVFVKSHSPFSFITIYNQQGQVYFKKETPLTNKIQLDLSKLNNGVYIMELNNQGKMQKSKLIIQK